MSAIRRHGIYLLPLLLLPFLWWWPLLTGMLPDYMDSVTYLFPLRLAVAQQLHSGWLPLWLPNLFAGTPLAANPQVATWYPPQLLFYLLPNAFGYGLLAILHYCLAGVGMYLLTLHLCRSRAASALNAFVFQFGSMMIGRIALMPHVYAAAWAPWIFLASERVLAEPGRPRRWDLLLALFLAMQLLAGAPQITYYTGIALLLLWIVRIAQRMRSSRLILLMSLRGGTSVLLCLAICAIQIVPTAEFLTVVRRHAIAVHDLVEQALNGGYIWKSLIGFTIPGSEDIDSINAVGVIPYIFAIIAISSRATRSAGLPYMLVSAVGWFMSLGFLAPFWARVVPAFDHFHAPRRALMLWSICIPVASALGVTQLAAMARERKLMRVVFAVMCLLTFAGTAWILPRLERAFCDTEHLLPDKRYTAAIGSSRFLTIDPTLNYSYDSRRADYGQSLVPNGAIFGGVNDAQGYDPLMLESVAHLRDLACRQTGIFYPGHGVFYSDPLSPALQLLDVQYVIGRYDLFDPSRLIPGTYLNKAALAQNLVPVIADERWPLFRLRQERKAVWTVENVIGGSESSAADPWTFADPYKLVSVSDREAGNSTTYVQRSASVEWTTSRSLSLRLGTAKHPGISLVCVSVPFVPGWRAQDENGKQYPVEKVDGVILGIELPSDVSSVELSYLPLSFWRGLLISIAALVLTAALWLRFRPDVCVQNEHAN